MEAVRTAEQEQFELDLETPDALESKAMILLREFRTLDADIRFYERRARGDGLLIQPSVTRRLGAPEDDEDVLWALATDTLTASEQDVLRVLGRYLSPDLLRADLRGKSRLLPEDHTFYATVLRIRAVLAEVAPQTSEDKEIVDGVMAMLEERMGDPEDRKAVHLTETERAAVMRWKEIERARGVLLHLRENREKVGAALDHIETCWPDEHRILTLRYIEGCTTAETMDRMLLSEWMYRDLRKRAMIRFLVHVPVDSLRTGLLDKSPYKKRGPKMSR